MVNFIGAWAIAAIWAAIAIDKMRLLRDQSTDNAALNVRVSYEGEDA